MRMQVNNPDQAKSISFIDPQKHSHLWTKWIVRKTWKVKLVVGSVWLSWILTWKVQTCTDHCHPQNCRQVSWFSINLKFHIMPWRKQSCNTRLKSTWKRLGTSNPMESALQSIMKTGDPIRLLSRINTSMWKCIRSIPREWATYSNEINKF